MAMLVVGAVGSFTDLLGEDSLWWGGVTLRTGAILGVFWLILPKARKVPRAILVGMVVFAGFVALRPRLVLLGVAASFLAMVGVGIAQRRAAAK